MWVLATLKPFAVEEFAPDKKPEPGDDSFFCANEPNEKPDGVPPPNNEVFVEPLIAPLETGVPVSSDGVTKWHL